MFDKFKTIFSQSGKSRLQTACFMCDTKDCKKRIDNKRTDKCFNGGIIVYCDDFYKEEE